MLMLFGIILLVSALTYLLPAGAYERVEVAGRLRVVPDSYRTVEQSPISFLDIFRAFPEGYRVATPIIFICLASALMFAILDATGALENAVGRLLHKLGTKRAELVLVLLTLFYGLLGIMVGYENNIATIPIGAVVVLALGGDLVLAAGVTAGGMTVAFGLSPINPYTVGIGHELAELPLFSGAALRTVLCTGGLALMAWWNLRYFRRLQRDPASSLGADLDASGLVLSRPLADYRVSARDGWLLGVFFVGLGVVLFGVFNLGWFINDISAVFLVVFVVLAASSGLSLKQINAAGFRGIAQIAPATFIIGMAATVKVLLEQGQIQDTISYGLAQVLGGLPATLSALGMTVGQSGLNMLIPSGSGQALATLPVMLPLGDSLGLTRQVTILAFQIGDGVTNLFNPAMGGLLAMLSLCRVPFDRWLRFVLPLVGWLLGLCWLVLVLGVVFGY